MEIPKKEECLKILKDTNLPENIVEHLRAVCDFSMKVVDIVEDRGIKINRELVAAAALLHDVKKLSPDHEITGADYISSLGYPQVAQVIRKHGLSNLNKEDCIPRTWEEKIVFYSDKRLKGSKIVSVDERFEDIRKRYKRDIIEHEYQLTKKIEKELLGEIQI